ncbi:hypothetical protein AB9_159 [Acinetobacter phage vB_AbaM_B9]|nr:hypothetical protein AB9_003 [Acinetobacter phage vB_AbaM_B9]AWD93268.1 hypothetical protein AB9_159 [Acinetobacter phage vB_AbaM_B9]
MNNMINVPVEFVIDALQARYDDVKDKWSNDASEALWEQALQLVEECGLGSDITSSSAYVDNYLINGEFVSKESDFDEWTKDYKESYDFSDSVEVEAAWNEYCQDNALIYNDEYACLSF